MRPLHSAARRLAGGEFVQQLVAQIRAGFGAEAG